MHFLPSFLEYSDITVKQKISLLEDLSQDKIISEKEIKQFTADYTYLHLDIISKYFAQDKNVLMSLDSKSYLAVLEKYFSQQNIHLSIHLMGNVEDLVKEWQFYSNHVFLNQWQYSLYIPYKYFQSWRSLTKDNVKIGCWYDLDQWYQIENFNFNNTQISNILLMTVNAGKSGQKSNLDAQIQALKLVTNHPDVNFILDGGWKTDLTTMLKSLPKSDIEAYYKLKNLDIVVNSDFWRKYIIK
jgi:pentose-5-phosphate-3-epimerase